MDKTIFETLEIVGTIGEASVSENSNNNSWDCCTTESTSCIQTLPLDSYKCANSSENEDSTITVGGENMSLCMAIAFPDKVYIAADSKSSCGTVKATFNDSKYIDIVPLSYSYKKIFKIVTQDDSKPIIGYSIGINKFEGMNLLEFIKSLDFSNCETLYQAAIVIKNYINKNILNINCSFILYRYEGDTLLSIAICKEKGEHKLYLTDFKPDEKEAKKTASGVNWAVELSDYTAFIVPEHSEEATLLGINEIYNKARIVGPFYNNAVGGDTHIGKLTPEGFEWLQNGYEL